MPYNLDTEEKTSYVGAIFLIVLTAVFIIALMMWGIPTYNVWQKGLAGEAALTQARQTKQIMIETARAEVDSAELRAKAIEIVGQAAKDYPEYRQQEFMGSFGEALREGVIDQIIYIPTEANVPIMEAGKR